MSFKTILAMSSLNNCEEHSLDIGCWTTLRNEHKYIALSQNSQYTVPHKVPIKYFCTSFHDMVVTMWFIVIVSLQTPMPLYRSSISLRKVWQCETLSIPPGIRHSSSMRLRFSTTLRLQWPLRPTLWWSSTIQTHMWVFVCVLVFTWASVTNRKKCSVNLFYLCFKPPGCRWVHGPLCLPALPDCFPPPGLVPDSPSGQKCRRASSCLPAHTQRKGWRKNLITLSSVSLQFLNHSPLVHISKDKFVCICRLLNFM